MNEEEIDKVLIGVSSQKQLEEVIEASNKKINNSLLPFTNDDLNLINPSLWK